MRHFEWQCGLVGLAGLVSAAGCAVTLPGTRLVGGESRLELRADLPEKEAAGVLAEADAFLVAVSGELGLRIPSPCIWVFKGEWDYWLYVRSECPALGGREGVCFRRGDGEIVVAVRGDANGRPDRRRLRHELTHAVVAGSCAEPMPWLDEGLAQVFEGGCPAVEDTDRLARVARLEHLEPRLRRVVSLVRHAELNVNDYLVAWGLARFLLSDERQGPGRVRCCLGPPVLGEVPEVRFRRCIGAWPDELAADVMRAVGARRERRR